MLKLACELGAPPRNDAPSPRARYKTAAARCRCSHSSGVVLVIVQLCAFSACSSPRALVVAAVALPRDVASEWRALRMCGHRSRARALADRVTPSTKSAAKEPKAPHYTHVAVYNTLPDVNFFLEMTNKNTGEHRFHTIGDGITFKRYGRHLLVQSRTWQARSLR